MERVDIMLFKTLLTTTRREVTLKVFSRLLVITLSGSTTRSVGSFSALTCLPPDEDSLELHMVRLELEDVEKQIRGQLDKQAQLQERRTALETLCASAYTSKTRPNAVIVGDSIVRKVSGILKKDERIGAVVLHAGTNDIRLRQLEVLKRDFSSLIKAVRGRSPTAKIIVFGPFPTFRHGAEKFS
ncbi:hypothetical protein AMELA_G00179750 [Ameiurus melas]|uniref:SGNH hydrolase-type esterase domain-containing protein n=1 Tax=Ameiurus melas TaxID=219545 RepID=A0A7J6A9Z8_AMEME|nr:hypothetical protein AMELA_G00179750 [Ameiurus melas]